MAKIKGMRPELKVPKSKYRFDPEIKPVRFWRNPIFIVILFGLLVWMFFKLSSPKEIIDSAEYTFAGRCYRVNLEGKAELKQWQGSGFLAGRRVEQSFQLAKEVVIYEKQENESKWQEKKRYQMEGVGPWCVALGQMDDKKDIEVFIGAFRATRFFPEGTRPYILSWDFEKQKLLRLWTGSYLNAPIFLDAEMVDIDGDGYEEIKVQEIEWIGNEEKNYESYYSYNRQRFEPFLKSRIEKNNHKK